MEGAQYRRLLGSGRKAPEGRINLTFTETVTGECGAQHKWRLEDISELYIRTRPARMVITGAKGGHLPGVPGADQPGSEDAGTGKTVLALSLIIDLVRKRQQDDPLPVRLSATSWPGGDIRTWLEGYLREVYGLGRRDIQLIVEGGLVFPVIDGLDELDSDVRPGYDSRAAALLRYLQEFEMGGEPCPAVLTCRRDFYQALIDSGAIPQADTHITVDPVSPDLARGYLEQRAAATPAGQQRWAPVLNALRTAASDPSGRTAGNAAKAHALARALETPWRLTLTVTVFEARNRGGSYQRDPASLIPLAANQRLGGYLLDRYIDAAVTAPHHSEGDIDRTELRQGETEKMPHLDAAATWVRLALIADYLDANNRLQRKIFGRTLSGTEIVLHELWPLAGARLVRWTSRMVALFMNLAFGAVIVWLGSTKHLWTVILLSVVALASLWNTAWPRPHRIDFRRFSVWSGGSRLLAGLGSGCFSWMFLGLLFGLFGFLGGLAFGLGGGLKGGFSAGLEYGLSGGLGIGLTTGLASWLLASERNPITDPREVVRGDCITAITFGLAFGLLMGILVGFAAGPTAGVAVALVSTLATGFQSQYGQVSIRYFSFLICTRGRFPWRLGRFLHNCYQLNILRVAGAAWQFRHRELQDHLVEWPNHPNHSRS